MHPCIGKRSSGLPPNASTIPAPLAAYLQSSSTSVLCWHASEALFDKQMRRLTSPAEGKMTASQTWECERDTHQKAPVLPKKYP